MIEIGNCDDRNKKILRYNEVLMNQIHEDLPHHREMPA